MRKSIYRIYLILLFRVLLLVGILFTLYPFITSLINTEPQRSHLETNLEYYDPISLVALQAGDFKKITLAYVPIWIYRLRESEFEQLPKLQPLLAEPLFSVEQSQASNTNEILAAKYFVFKPLESIRSCQLRYLAQSSNMTILLESHRLSWLGGFTESCYASVYDLLGRRFKNTGKQQQLNLSIPKYLIFTNNEQHDIIQFNKPLTFQARD